MKITQLQLVNFKRFTDLTIQDIPRTSKLILLIGANGSGKSSVLDAFGFVNNSIRLGFGIDNEFWNYFQKNKNQSFLVEVCFDNNNIHTISKKQYGKKSVLPVTTFYGRTSFRQIPRLTRTALGQKEFNIQKDSDRPKFFIDKDERFENDLEKITETILKEFFRTKQSNEQIIERYIAPINTAFENIFGNDNGTKLELLEIIPPLDGKVAQINFRKGESEFHYNYLSAGEKEVFNLLINLLSRSKLYQDTVYFFDEIDLHLNTKIQFNLLKEITENWIPENCQLWTASHSLGFIEYAKQTDIASIIDFDSLDFDLPKVLTPEPKDNPDIYEIAVGKEFLPSLFQHINIYFVENKDKVYYASIGISKTIFVSDNQRNDVFHKVINTDYYGIVDRDFLSDDDRFQITKHYPKLVVLEYYSIENYLYHPDNLEEYYNSTAKSFDKKRYTEAITTAKNEVKTAISARIASDRGSYPYFKEPDFAIKKLQNRFRPRQENYDQTENILNYLHSNDLEIFYKVLPMKSYCTQLSQRQNIAKSELVKTSWFKMKIEALLIQ